MIKRIITASILAGLCQASYAAELDKQNISYLGPIGANAQFKPFENQPKIKTH